jgi:hypothetical protein
MDNYLNILHHTIIIIVVVVIFCFSYATSTIARYSFAIEVTFMSSRARFLDSGSTLAAPGLHRQERQKQSLQRALKLHSHMASLLQHFFIEFDCILI